VVNTSEFKTGPYRYTLYCTGCPTRYRTRHFFNNSNTNDDIATKQENTTDTFLGRSSTLPTTKQDRRSTCKRNPLHHEDSISNTAIQYLLHQSTIQDVIHDRSNKHRAKLQSHPNPLLQSLLRDNIHSDLGIPTVQDVIHDRSNKHRAKLQSHPNPLLQTISRDNIPRRLKRRWSTDL